MASRGVNKVILVGRVGQDVEQKFLPNGTAVVSLTLATSEEWKDKAGDKQSRTEWHRCVAYQRLAEIIGEYVKKGQQLYIEGKLQTRSWEQEGVKRYQTEIIVSEMQMIGDKPSGGERQATSQTRGQPAHHSSQPAPQADDGFVDDLPF